MDIRGVYPPIPTPFTEDDRVDVKGMSQNVDRWMSRGIQGVVVLGSTGEAPLIDEQESDMVVGAVRARIPSDRVLIVGTARESTKATVEASNRAAALGADAVLVRTPAYFKPQMTCEAFKTYYTAVADITRIPLILYNYSALTGVNLSVEAVAQLAEHQNIVAMKESSGDIGLISNLVDQTPTDFNVLVGSAAAFCEGLSAGAAGGVLAAASIVPNHCVDMYVSSQLGRDQDAIGMQLRLMPLLRLISRAHGVPAIKAALDLLGYVGGAPRPPLSPATKDLVAKLSCVLRELGLVVGGGSERK